LKHQGSDGDTAHSNKTDRADCSKTFRIEQNFGPPKDAPYGVITRAHADDHV
jgi:hypothetical protein